MQRKGKEELGQTPNRPRHFYRYTTTFTIGKYSIYYCISMLNQVPKRRDVHQQQQQQQHFLGGVVKSKSFATPGQFECSLDDSTADEKKRTMLAFFNHSSHQGNLAR